MGSVHPVCSRSETRARHGPEAHPMTGVRCDAVVAADARVTFGGRRSALRFPGTVFWRNWSVGGAGVDSDSDIVHRIHLLAKKLSAIGRSAWNFFTCENRWI